MMHSSTIFTIGTALRRASEADMPVEVLVEGHWLRGVVAGVDGHGLVLTTHAEHAVIRLEAISAVRIPEALDAAPKASATQEGVDAHMLALHPDGTDAWAMPGSVTA
jgi:sRNA-binding regulator protein Hfq